MKYSKSLLCVATLVMGLSIRSQAQDRFTNGLVAYYPFHGNANDVWGGRGTHGKQFNASREGDQTPLLRVRRGVLCLAALHT